MKAYCNCTKKTQARLESIIEPYKELFNHNSLPLNKQYITLCASHKDLYSNNLSKDSELDQLINEKFISSLSQFHGVDKDPNIINENRTISYNQYKLLDVTGCPTWHMGRLTNVINGLSCQQWYDPGVINYDSINMPNKASDTLNKLFHYNRNINELLIVSNFVLRARHKICDPSLLFEELKQYNVLKTAKENGFSWKEAVYVYNGTGRTSTIMGTVLFFK
jgi:hypothetical protein